MPAAAHWQSLPHRHGAPLACGIAGAAAWQPQVQPMPGQAVQRQRLVSWEFMAFPLLGVEPGGSVETHSVETRRRRIERNG